MNPTDPESVLPNPHVRFMAMALREAEAAAEEEEVPCGAVIVRAGQVLGRAHNQVERLHDPTAHAEILAITQAAAALRDWRLTGCTMYVTKEPCSMCAGAIVLARIAELVFAFRDLKRGGAVSRFSIVDCPSLNHQVKVTQGVMAEECLEVLQAFFRKRRLESDD
ncbi:MAG: tRNA adenosine(34) deaminase TadA [Kiritimatiellia bacterium]